MISITVIADADMPGNTDVNGSCRGQCGILVADFKSSSCINTAIILVSNNIGVLVAAYSIVSA